MVGVEGECKMRRVRVATMVLLALGAGPAAAAEQDAQAWAALQLDTTLTERWDATLSGELQTRDNVSAFQSLILDGGAFYRASPRVKLGLGYQYTVAEPGKSDEQAPWQSLEYTHGFRDLTLGYKLRLDERIRDDTDGVLPRLRLGLRVTYPLGEAWYAAASEEIRFNLRDPGTGPVGGFEQNRVYAGLGRKIDERARVEFGYLWRFERERGKPDRSDNVLFLQFVISADMRAASGR